MSVLLVEAAGNEQVIQGSAMDTRDWRSVLGSDLDVALEAGFEHGGLGS